MPHQWPKEQLSKVPKCRLLHSVYCTQIIRKGYRSYWILRSIWWSLHDSLIIHFPLFGAIQLNHSTYQQHGHPSGSPHFALQPLRVLHTAHKLHEPDQFVPEVLQTEQEETAQLVQDHKGHRDPDGGIDLIRLIGLNLIWSTSKNKWSVGLGKVKKSLKVEQKKEVMPSWVIKMKGDTY